MMGCGVVWLTRSALKIIRDTSFKCVSFDALSKLTGAARRSVSLVARTFGLLGQPDPPKVSTHNCAAVLLRSGAGRIV